MKTTDHVSDHAAINELHRLADGLRAIPGWKSASAGMKTVARGGVPDPLPPPLPRAYAEVWEPRFRRPVRSWIRVVATFLVSALIWSAFILALIIVAAELSR